MKIGCGRAAATGCAEQSVREALPRRFVAQSDAGNWAATHGIKAAGKLGCQRLCAQKAGSWAANDLLKKRAEAVLPTAFCAQKLREAVLPCVLRKN